MSNIAQRLRTFQPTRIGWQQQARPDRRPTVASLMTIFAA